MYLQQVLTELAEIRSIPGDCGLGVVQARSSTGRQMRGSGREKRKEISHAYSSKVMNGTLVV